MAGPRQIHNVTVDENFEQFEQVQFQGLYKEQYPFGICFGLTASIMKSLFKGTPLLNKDPGAFFQNAKVLSQEATDAYKDGENEFKNLYDKMDLPHERLLVTDSEQIKKALAESKGSMLTYKTKSGYDHTIGFFKQSEEFDKCVAFDPSRGVHKGGCQAAKQFILDVVGRSDPGQVSIDRVVMKK